MFCKWCGKTIKSTDKCCPDCGRETPAMSDCGGLYDLRCSTAPSALKASPTAEKAEKEHDKDRQAARKHHTAMIVCFAVMVALVFFLLAVCIRIMMQIGELEKEVKALKTSFVQNTEPETDMTPSDRTDTSKPPNSTEDTGSEDSSGAADKAQQAK